MISGATESGSNGLTRLNIGAGNYDADGWIPIDLKLGHDARKLDYPDNSVDEIRASHVLEHFSFSDALAALKEWVRVIKPGGRIRVSVPDAGKIRTTMEGWRFMIMGGQTTENDFHRSCYDAQVLGGYMAAAGLEQIQPWISDEIPDLSRMAFSCNLEGIKRDPTRAAGIDIKIVALMSIPRVGWNDNWGSILESLAPFRIPVHRFSGVYWDQCMQRGFERALKCGVDWILTIDYDSVFMPLHVDRLLGCFGNHPEIDALASIQSRRQNDYPLATCMGKDQVEVTGEPILATSAHFGLTLLRVECLKDLARPWFYSQPSESGQWDDGRMDADIWFWHQWRKAGKTLYLAPDVRIGHLELMVSDFDEHFNHRLSTMPNWRKLYGIDDEKAGFESAVEPTEEIGTDVRPHPENVEPLPGR